VSIPLFNNEPVPVIVNSFDPMAATIENSRNDNPLSPQKISGLGFTFPLLMIKIELLFFCTVAPQDSIIESAARSSLLYPGLKMVVMPQFSKPSAQARCIMLLLGGATKSPLISEGRIFTRIA
jgi:hypothetical protein